MSFPRFRSTDPESDAILRSFIESAPVALAMFDRDMRYLACSHRWLADYQLGDRDIIGRSHYEIFPEISDHWRDVHQRGLAGEIVRSEEDAFTRSDGTVQWLRWEVQPWHTAGSKIGGIIIFSEDITERKLTEMTLRQSEANLRALFSSTLQAFILFDRERRLLAINPVANNWARQILGRPLQVGESGDELSAQFKQDNFRQQFERVLQGETITQESKIATPSGDLWFEVNQNPVVMGGEEIVGSR